MEVYITVTSVKMMEVINAPRRQTCKALQSCHIFHPLSMFLLLKCIQLALTYKRKTIKYTYILVIFTHTVVQVHLNENTQNINCHLLRIVQHILWKLPRPLCPCFLNYTHDDWPKAVCTHTVSTVKLSENICYCV